MNIWSGITWLAEVAEAAHQADHALRGRVGLHKVLWHHRLSHLTVLGGLQNQSHGCMYHSAPLCQDGQSSPHHDMPSCSTGAPVMERQPCMPITLTCCMPSMLICCIILTC